VIAKGGEGEQEGFINKGVKEDKELKLVILLKLSKRVAKHIKKQQERIVKKAREHTIKYKV
jgi:hypothetical protein